MLARLEIYSVIETLDASGQPEGEPEVNTTAARANLRYDGGDLHLSYTQNSEGGSVICHLIAFADGKVSLSQRGGIVSDILFSPGEECHTVYSIPPYKFDMTVRTDRVELSVGETPVRIKLTYTMNIGGEDRRTHLTLTAE